MDETPDTTATTPDDPRVVTGADGTPAPAPTNTAQAAQGAAAAPEDTRDVFEKTRDFQLQAWQAQSAINELLTAMTAKELSAYIEQIDVRQQNSPEGSDEQAAWNALKSAAELKRDNKKS